MTKSVIIRVDTSLLEKYQERHPETKGLTYSRLVDLMLRKVLENEKKKLDEGKI